MKFDINLYTPVQQRIGTRPLEATFIEDFPEGRIQTELVFHNNDFSLIIFKAAAYRTPEDPRPTTGWAIEKQFIPKESRDYFNANVSSWVENCETSAVGRALANMGYTGTKAQRPSREEMDKVNRVAEAHLPVPTPIPSVPRSEPVPPIAVEAPVEAPVEAVELPTVELPTERVPGSITEELLVALNDILDSRPMHPNHFEMNLGWVLAQVRRGRAKIGIPNEIAQLPDLSIYEAERVIKGITEARVK